MSLLRIIGPKKYDASLLNVEQNVTQQHIGLHAALEHSTHTLLSKRNHSVDGTKVIEAATSTKSISQRDVKFLDNGMPFEDSYGDLNTQVVLGVKREDHFPHVTQPDIKRLNLSYNKIDFPNKNEIQTFDGVEDNALLEDNKGEFFSPEYYKSISIRGIGEENITYFNIPGAEEDIILGEEESRFIESADKFDQEYSYYDNEMDILESPLQIIEEEADPTKATNSRKNSPKLEDMGLCLWGNISLSDSLKDLYAKLNECATKIYNLTKDYDCEVVRENKRYVIKYPVGYDSDDKEKVEEILSKVENLLGSKNKNIRVDAEKNEGSLRGSGLDELFKTSETLEFFFRSTGLVNGVEPYSEWEGDDKINWLDLQLNLRIPTYLVLFYNGEGHTGAVYGKKSGEKLTGQKIKGQAEEHDKRQTVIAKSKTPLLAAERALRHMHKVMMINTADFKAASGKNDDGDAIAIYQKEIYNIWGKDLSNSDNRTEFADKLSVVRTNIARCRNFIRNKVINSKDISIDTLSDTKSLKDSIVDPNDKRLISLKDLYDWPVQPTDPTTGM